MGQCSFAGTELAQDGGGLVLVQPAQHGVRSLAGDQVLVQACSSARTSPVPPPSSSLSRARRLHRARERERGWRWCPHAGHERQNDASGRVQGIAQNGAVRVPLRIGLTSPHRAHRCCMPCTTAARGLGDLAGS